MQGGEVNGCPCSLGSIGRRLAALSTAASEITHGRWQTTQAGRRMTQAGWRMADGGWRMADGKPETVASGQWPVNPEGLASGERIVGSGQ